MMAGAAPAMVCFGNLTLDDLVQPDGTERPLCIGGDALYGVLAARLWQPDAEMVAPVGRDLPARVRRIIAAAGLSTEGLPERECATLHNRIVYQTHDRRIVTMLSDAEDFETMSPRASDVPERFWSARAFVILAMTLAAQRDLVRACRARGRGIVALDPQEEYIEGNEAAILDLVGQVDIFMPSLDEVRRLLGHDDPERAVRQFAALGPGTVVVKMGAEGSLVHDAASGLDLRVPACPVDPVDTTGAGDAFCSAFVAVLAGAALAGAVSARQAACLRSAATGGAVAAALAIAAVGPDGLFKATPASARAALARWYPDGP